MKTVLFPYGKEKIEYTFDSQLSYVLESSIENYNFFTLPMALNYQRNSYKLWERYFIF